ncbi:PD-(D/E)XK nuclease family protein [uncultured Methylibium sp.]|uniref:PD-(D/E)XK nuclease family protein n=1 Tax=uncultured Methylibium sp. TaxID=381093 RepID=UPI0025F9BCFC|nr:PD-(D/E)XK nuclease family protein [uncultured Methylibium sp.]
MSATELWLSLVSCAACVGAVWAAARLVRRRAAEANEWMPGELKDHTLAYSERTFRSGGNRQVVARVDRAYRGRNGLITLVELKTRHANRFHLSDVIELSAQRVALAGETGEPVARIGWVVVESSARRTAHRVTLMSPQAVWELASRRDELLAGTESPSYTATRGVCASCAHRRRCRTGAEL